MKTIQVKAHLRTETGKKDSKNLRKENNVPCVMYGGEEIVHFYAHENTFKDIIYTPNIYIIDLDIDGKVYKAILQELQFHPVTDKVTHIDFVQVFEDKPVVMSIPINVVGNSVGVEAGGKTRLKRRTLKVKGSFIDLPDALDIDITDLAIGMSMKVHQLSYDNLELLDPPRAMVIAVISSRLAVMDLDVEEEEVEGEEGEEGEGEGEEAVEGAESTETPTEGDSKTKK